jgi:CRISPR-associated protein Csh1
MQVYLEALDKIQKYLKNYNAYSSLREIINNYFTLRKQDMTAMSNNELSFYFVAGLEMGSRFKKEKKEDNTESK